MDLIQITKNVLKARERQISEEEWTELKEDLEKSIKREFSSEILKFCLSLDTNDTLPFEQKKLIFEQILKLKKTKEILKNFAWWLQLNGGPDYDKYANDLLIEAQLDIGSKNVNE